MIKPFPTPMEYDPDMGVLSVRGAHVACLAGVDDFPCLDPEEVDCAALEAEIDATGEKLARAYNAHDALLAACEAAVFALEPYANGTGYPSIAGVCNDLKAAIAAARK